MTMNSRLLTGDRPTGPLHIGHYVGSLRNRVNLQNKYDSYILIADMQALTDNFQDPQKVKNNILEVALDYLAVGINPKKSTIFIQSMIPELSELTMYFMNLVTVSHLRQNPTVKTEIAQKNFGESVPVGFFVYPVSQAADITLFNTNVVPVGADQLPMIEQAREIVRRFNYLYDEILIEPEAIIPTGMIARLPGIDGKAKMSKSLNNAIYLSDSSESLEQKVRSMYTDPNHLRVSDPGKIEGNMVFTYLDAFDQNIEKVKEFKEHYQRGGLGDMFLKKYLFEILDNELKPIRERREFFANNKDEVEKILQDGTQKAREIAAITMDKVRSAMQLNYF